jgi:hypothetical protein
MDRLECGHIARHQGQATMPLLALNRKDTDGESIGSETPQGR